MSTTLVTDGAQAPRDDNAERWSARGNDVSGQLDSWSEILASTHLSFEISATHRTPAPFVGGVVRRPIGDLMLVDCAAAPFRGHRDKAMIGANGPSPKEDVLGFQFVHKGVESVRESGREIMVTAGHVVMWDGLQPTDIEIVQPFYKRTLLFPRSRVLAVCPRLAELDGLPSLNDSGPARLLVRYMNALAAELPTLAPSAVIAAANVALELLRTVVEPELPAGRAAERTALRADIRRYVRTHLRDPELSPTSIAREFAMSIRALHALFEDGAESVAVLVRNERLQRCLEDLQQRNGGSITEIAFRWGFCDAAHFSRVFKRRYGATPSEVRHAAVTGTPMELTDRESA
ncbi:MAG TPA: helix-turn-helix domain-containing protein [Solirubrobacteraceae bacterium]|nr:helix-turn-helix domain-containing protein [Solirubrobacteraceae bacterium]